MTLVDCKSISFAVFVQGRSLDDWEWRAIELLGAAGASCLFILTPSAVSSGLPSRAVTNLIRRFAGLPAEQEGEPQRYRPSMTCTVEFRGTEPTLDAADRRRIADLKLKFILHLGVDEIPTGLAACAELGVWRFTRSSGAAGALPFLDGLCRRDDVVNFGLEQVSAHDDHRRLLRSGHFRARGERNRSVSAQVVSEASRWPLQALKHVRLNGDLPKAAASLDPSPGSFGAFALILSLLTRDIMVQLASKLASYLVLETWNVGFVRFSFQALLAGIPVPKIALLPRREFGRYVADPFVLSTSPTLTLLVEDFTDFGVGRISEMTVKDPLGSPDVDLKIRLESSHHLSYPFVFHQDGITYCLPECCQSNASVLYKYDAGALLPVANLVPGARVTDGTIFRHEGRYWLFCGLENDSDQVNLHLFFSDTLQAGWTPHPLNPVKTDIRSSRSAGPIIQHGGKLYRPTQDCSQSYGYGVSINRIECLTVSRFEESVVLSLRPEIVSRSCKGLHTLSFVDDLMVIDAKFHLIGFEPILVRFLRRIKRLRHSLSRAVRSRSSNPGP